MRRLVVIMLSIGFVFALTAPAQPQGRVRKCVNIERLYGWFPGERGALRAAVDKYLADAGEVKVEGKPVAVIAPHAGYRWSGATAAYAFKPLKGLRYRRVILLGPSHHAAYVGGSIADVDAYETPLGRIPLDGPTCRKLLAADICRSRAEAHAQEHSLQNELPFLQRVLTDWELVPVVIGAYQKDGDVEKLADALKSVVTPDTLIVVSSDFTHFGPRFRYTPFTRDLKENIRRLDQGAIDRICAVDWKGFRDYTKKTGATICGRHPIAAMLKVFEGRKDIRGKLVRYATSGDQTGDYRNSVSYAAIVLSKVEAVPATDTDVEVIADAGAEEKAPLAERLTEAEQRLLLKMARAQLEAAVKERQMIEPKDYGWDLTRKLLSQGAVFSTLKNDGRLRGCIGDIIPHQPLYMSVLRNTVNAALNDPRFRRSRITSAELPDIDIEISYLTPPKQVQSYTEIVVGKHGVILQKGYNRAVYLPQVAIEQKWDRDTMLRHLSMKARLPEDAYKEGCTFLVFEAQVFGEKELGMSKKK